MRTRTLAATLLTLPMLLLGLAACGDDGDDGSGDTSDPGTEPDGAAPEGATPGGGDSDLFIEVAFVGGFVPADFHFRNVPAAVVYGDGTVIAPGVTTLQFPGPAAMPLATGQLDDDTLAELLDLAAAAGMVGGVPEVGDASAIPVADAPSTRITVVVDGDSQVVEAYALAELGGGFGQTNLTDAQVEARAALAELVAAVNDAALAAGDTYRPERYHVLASTPPPADGFEVAPNELAWPEGLPEPVDNECVSISGDDVGALEAALASATEITRWSVGDRVVALAVRPVLPHEPDC